MKERLRALNEVNLGLSRHAAKHPHMMRFVPFPFRNALGPKWSVDRVHLSSLGYAALADALTPAVRSMYVRAPRKRNLRP